MERIYQALAKAGWFAGRKLETSINPESFPVKIKDFCSEFGELQIDGGLSTKIIIPNLNRDFISRFSELIDAMSRPINVDNQENDYYYSVILGIPILEVAYSIQDPFDHFFIDPNGRFYYLSTIPQFFWFGDNPIDALSKLLLFGGESAVLDEEALKWNVRKNEESKHQLPINPNLTQNPWL